MALGMASTLSRRHPARLEMSSSISKAKPISAEPTKGTLQSLGRASRPTFSAGTVWAGGTSARSSLAFSSVFSQMASLIR